MAGMSPRLALLTALLSWALYHFLSDPVSVLGLTRAPQPLGAFPYRCRRVTRPAPALQACEDMWLDEKHRHLYVACAGVRGRRHWLPAVGKRDAGRRSMDDRVVVLDVDREDGAGGFAGRVLATPGFEGTAGEGALHNLAVRGRRVSGEEGERVQLFLVNLRPATEGGVVVPERDNPGNATVELFEVEAGAATMRHVRTFAHPLIATPNNIALLPDGSGFYVSNDHGLQKTGWQNSISPYVFGGNVVYCSTLASDTTTSCRIVAKGLSFPNGLVIHPSDPKTLYVPSASIGVGVTIYRINKDKSLSKITHLKVPYAMDNLTPSSDGSIYAAAFPKVFDSVKTFDDPDIYTSPETAESKMPPSVVLKISKLRNLVNDGKEVSWTWEKVVEDAHGEALPMSTVALKDAKTGRLFISGVHSYFITVCEPK